ncbi:bifunctional 4-hydroxy-2-oxoglutarate aldolase/2-dehydro-3-deoxy-phosphogluconate aldolase [Microbacterium sp. NPDC076911]|uniref:bifunctional 4-hydroxy-2-oxoglutarate aldolase/2-dehydro-3-deoxy-phosphogluconate aldolase n=1 Tax=Microbacterium sp. NPDC076911 TaxID=3154958 RepID=UPI00343F4FC4
MTSLSDQTGDRLSAARSAGVLAVLRAPSSEAALDAIDALVRGGITGIEVTYSTPDAAAVIAAAKDRHGESAYVGAGTVTTGAQAREAADAGAAFLVSPGTLAELAGEMRATGVVTMTGALTPSEVMTAQQLGVDVVKIFPASLGGPAYLGALRGPFPTANLMPTGGVTPENLGAWFAAGAVAVGAGGDLVPGKALATGDFAEIERRARLFATALQAAKAEGSAS